MAHLLLLEVPGGNDFTVLEDAIALGHSVTFVTGDLDQYRRQGEAIMTAMAKASRIIEVAPFSYAALERAVLTLHAETPVEAVLCILDIRMVEASQLAQRLGLAFLNPATTRMARDKVSVRARLAERQVRQPAFALVETAEDLTRAIAAIGYPVLIKPADGYASQNIHVLFSEGDLQPLVERMAALARNPTDYGLGVQANNRYSVERYVRGAMIGCDVFTTRDRRIFLGVNDKAMLPPPSFAMRGSCFPSTRHDTEAIRTYAFAILDAIDFDFGACHIEMIVAEDGPYLVEVNPRLVSAQIPFQLGYALERSLYADLIDLHLGRPLTALAEWTPRRLAAIRWMVAATPGTLSKIELPETADPAICRVVIFKQPGETVRPPIQNGDRIGYVIAVGPTQADAERIAEAYVAATRIQVT